jgi:hypothetical protein
MQAARRTDVNHTYIASIKQTTIIQVRLSAIFSGKVLRSRFNHIGYG